MDFLEEKKVTALVWATSAFHLVANSGVLEKKVLPAIAVTLLDLVEVAEIHEDESLQVEACEKVFFNNGLPGFERVQPRQG